jgi:hypothetical protein
LEQKTCGWFAFQFSIPYGQFRFLQDCGAATRQTNPVEFTHFRKFKTG